MHDGCVEVVYGRNRPFYSSIVDRASRYPARSAGCHPARVSGKGKKILKKGIKIIKEWSINIMKLVKCFIAKPWMASRGEHSGQGRRRKNAYRSI